MAAAAKPRVGLAPGPEAPHDCARCPRLVAYRLANQVAEPAWFNAPVPSLGCEASRLLIVGLAPSRLGGNRTGRPFTGDYGGELLYSALAEVGLADGRYAGRPDDGLSLMGVMISNAVRCAPPGNSPTAEEIAACRPFLAARMAALTRLGAVLALGRVAHDSVLKALGLRLSAFPFSHGARHEVGPGLALFDSYHCSRYNTNTGVLTEEMFRAVFAAVRRRLG